MYFHLHVFYVLNWRLISHQHWQVKMMSSNYGSSSTGSRIIQLTTLMPIRLDPHRKKSIVIFWWETALQSCLRCFPESLLLCSSHQAREILRSIMLIYGPCSSPSYCINVIQKQNEQRLSTRSKPRQFTRKFFPHEFPLLHLVFHSEAQSTGLINPSPALPLRDCLLLSEGFVWGPPSHPPQLLRSFARGEDIRTVQNGDLGTFSTLGLVRKGC